MNDAWNFIGFPNNVITHSREGISILLTSALHFAPMFIFLKYHLPPVTSLFQKSSTQHEWRIKFKLLSPPIIQGLLSHLLLVAFLNTSIRGNRCFYCSMSIHTPSILLAFTLDIHIVWRSTCLQSWPHGNFLHEAFQTPPDLVVSSSSELFSHVIRLLRTAFD